ncbi:MAG: aspartate aminotransferase family protein [Chloroflexi bacterium AL-W]|nr:aspartate aminotransferase family protein [Chloroflexi bacterium AL-N1]NOK65068.1 aspartate aminotransferase family protein [Chloroflexi bacterium AL-N10]NOK72665.1 aspartate aminotransferase family protein [Chloroflexi bacterium AL-N5]NOK79247.1 aspartate aminotransferase family protein [Chloroflexi bacterium AL-W]NOK87163.1 aspartate aminotransferase family protein [Chloroflexi bacterium AL-N15]
MISQETIITSESAHTSGTYPKRHLAIVGGQGARLWDAEGREYIDCVGGQGAANLGHANPYINEALQSQASRLINCPEIFYNDERAAYLDELVAVLPKGLERIFLCNSGAEAIEGALKIARLKTGRADMVTAVRGFHGRTMGALSATWEPNYRKPFEPLIPGFTRVPYNKIDALTEAVGDTTAAVLLELVQGEGGVHLASAEYIAAVAAVCRERGALLIIDEVQTGFGRTGALFACEHHGLEPDILVLAKSIAGGMPMGAIAFQERLGPLPPASHGTTFGGNPLACAAARATLRYLHDHDLPQQTAEKGVYLLERLRGLDLPQVREVRGKGLLVGLELKERVQPYLVRLMERGVLALPAGPNVLRLLPPLVITYTDLDQVVEVVGDL